MSENFLEQIRAKRTATPAIELRFDQHLGHYHDKPVLVVEGDDDHFFYRPIALRVYSPPVTKFNANNKDGVLSTFAHFKKKYPTREDVLFFIDRDFDDFLGIQHNTHNSLYITDFYSFENHLVCEEVLIELANEVMKIPLGEIKGLQLAKKFNSAVKKIHTDLSNAMALLVLIHRRAEKKPFSNIKMKDLFEFNEDLCLVRKLGVLTYFRAKLDAPASQYTPKEIGAIKSEFTGHSPKKYVRGHFEIFVLTKFLEALRDHCKKNKIRCRRQDIRLSDVPGYTTLGRPASLIDFFEKRLKENQSKATGRPIQENMKVSPKTNPS